MKKFNKNIILFIMIIVLIVAEYGKDFIQRIGNSALETALEVKSGNIDSIYGFTEAINKGSSEWLNYHDLLMDVNSVNDNLLGKRIIKKGDSITIKTDSDNLMGYRKRVFYDEVKETVSIIDTLKNISEENDAHFLYCLAPRKELYETGPENMDYFCSQNYESFLSEMKREKIPCLYFGEFLHNYLSEDEVFFRTDHHWTTKAGFYATKSICEELNNKYGFEFNEEYTHLENYIVETYPGWFLGSYGRKVGTYFSWKGADDFDLITPAFDTDFSEEQPYKGEHREGSFEDTLLFKANMKKDYYGVSTYATYSGGDFRLQIFKNNYNLNGKKAILVRDSFACVVAPFLALQFSETHICDMGDSDLYIGEKINLEEYIKKEKPDYVLVLYSDVTSIENSDGRYNFF